MSDESKNIKAYEQACNTIRHYSNMSFTTRIVSIVQGLVLLAAWIAANNNECNKALLIFVSSFGIAFTFLLFFFHRGYWDALEFLYSNVSKMEENLFDEGFRPHHEYNKIHVRKYKKIWRQILIIYAPFTLIGISFTIAMVFSICR